MSNNRKCPLDGRVFNNSERQDVAAADFSSGIAGSSGTGSKRCSGCFAERSGGSNVWTGNVWTGNVWTGVDWTHTQDESSRLLPRRAGSQRGPPHSRRDVAMAMRHFVR